MKKKDARMAGFHKLTFAQRLAKMVASGWLDEGEADELAGSTDGGLRQSEAEYRSENNVGTFALPWGVGLNLLVDGTDYIVPMAIEEPSVVAAVGYAAKLIRAGGGFSTQRTEDLMLGQIQFVDIPDPDQFALRLRAAEAALCAEAETLLPRLYARGGGLRAIELRALPGEPPMQIVELIVDVCDAMGANLVNTLAEELTPSLTTLAGREPILRILSNLADRRRVTATCTIPYDSLAKGADDGSGLAQRIEWASMFAERDPHRAVTHNKGIFNGIDAVVLASGNDWRQVEAAGHAWAARDGRYTALATWRRDPEARVLQGRLEIPLALGTVGPQIEGHARTRLFYRITGIKSAGELIRIVASTGLAQNLGALRALAAEGIQEGHMRLHARSVALAVECPPEQMNWLVEALIAGGEIKIDAALHLLADCQPAGPHS